MSIEIKLLTNDLEPTYCRFLQKSPNAMFNHSLLYRDFLREILKGSQDRYLCAFKDNQMQAVLPLFIKHGSIGAVVNSLPFFGSHGGIIGKPNLDRKISDALLTTLNDFCQKVNAISCTIIESPWEDDKHRYSSYEANLIDERVGQILSLPKKDKISIVEQSLMSLYHTKTRNMVRKGIKGGFDIDHNGSSGTLKILHTIHDEGIRRIGGTPKELSTFQAIQKIFKYNHDYRVYTARKNGQIVSALLLFYFKDMVEYYSPVTLESYRNQQPLSLLIFRAMCDAITEKQARYWNWGGTWLNQSGVYHFKSRWGTNDYPYRYHIKTFVDFKKENISKSLLNDKYKNYYSIPFTVFDK
ncbi:MAG: GNAT family N-acetyltransferase [Candidatus Neomarinimicrobiota bacterium]